MNWNIISFAILLATLASVTIAICVVWLCAHVHSAITRFFVGVADRDEADTARAVTITDSLLRIHEATKEAREASFRTAQKVEVSNQLGFQNAAASERVADDLFEAHYRANQVGDESPPGAAADVAAKGPPPHVSTPQP